MEDIELMQADEFSFASKPKFSLKEWIQSNGRIWLRHGLFLVFTGYLIAVLSLEPRRSAFMVCVYLFMFYRLYLSEWINLADVKYPTFPAIFKFYWKYSLLTLMIVSMLCSVFVGVGQDSNWQSRLRAFFGAILILILMYFCSHNRPKVNFDTLFYGIFIQYLIGIFILKTTVGFIIFSWINDQFVSILAYARQGSVFVFGPDFAGMHIFVALMFPTIIFFASIMEILYYYGIMQWIVFKLARVMAHVMGTSGSESVIASASPFVGQGESTLFVRPFVASMTLSEIHAGMTSGFSTIAGTELLVLLSMGLNGTALITACVMSTPCSLALSKLIYPETQDSPTMYKAKKEKLEQIEDGTEDDEFQDIEKFVDQDRATSVLQAAMNGSYMGLKLVGMILAVLIAFISIKALLNAFLGYVGDLVHVSGLSFETISSYVFFPFAWFMGVNTNECKMIASLLGEKMFVNEFAAYQQLLEFQKQDLISARGVLIATYALCGFANVGSIGIQIGCLTAIAPNRSGDFSRLAVSAMLTGTMCSFLTACFYGILS